MSSGFFHPEIQEGAIAEAKARDLARQRAAAIASPELAASIANVARRGRYLNPTVSMALARGGASNQAIDLANQQAAKISVTQPESPSNYFEKFVFDPFKKAVRFTSAAFQFTPEIVQSTASRLFNGGRGGEGSLFGTTTLGTMLQNPNLQGDGFLAGEDLNNLQAERARRYRGTTKGGNAFTLGRAAADLIATPDSMIHRLMSGFIDGAVQFIDPLTGFKVPYTALKVPGLIPEAAKLARGATEIPDASKAWAKVLQIEDEIQSQARAIQQRSMEEARGMRKGIIPFNDAVETARAARRSDINMVWDESEFSRWFNTNGGAQRLNKRVERAATAIGKRLETIRTSGAANIDAQAESALHTAAYKMNKALFRGKLDHDMALRLVGGESARNIIGEAAARLRADAELGLFPTNIRKLPGGRRWRPFNPEGAKYYRTSRFRNLFQEAPENTLMVRGTQLDRFRAVKNVENYLNAIPKLTPERREMLLGVVAKAYGGSSSNPTAVLEARRAVETVVEESLLAAGNPRRVVREVMRRYAEGLGKIRTQVSTVIGENNGHDMVQAFANAGIINEKKIIKGLAGKGTAISSLADIPAEARSALITSELLNQMQVLPDARQIRRLTQNPWYRKTVQRIYATKTGQQRAIFEAVEVFQNDIWKPLALMQPAYVLRNLIDGQAHIWLSADKSLKSLFSQPYAWLGYALGRQNAKLLPGMRRKALKAPGGIANEAFTAGVASALGREGEELLPAEEAWMTAASVYSSKYVGDAADIVRRGMATGDFVEVNRANNPTQHTLGILDQLRMLNRAPEVTWAFKREASDGAMGLSEDAVNRVLTWINSDPQRRQHLLDLSGNFVYGTDAAKVNVRVKYPRTIDIDPIARREMEDDQLRMWLNHEVGKRIAKWKNIPELRAMAAHNRVPIIEDGMSRVTISTVSPIKRGDPSIVSWVDEGGVGTIFDGGEFPSVAKGNPPFDWLVTNVRTVNNQKVWDVIPVYKQKDIPAWKSSKVGLDIRSEDYTEEAKDVVNALADDAGMVRDGLIPAKTGYMQRFDPNDAERSQRVMNRWRDLTDAFFGVLVAKGMDTMEKSPLFRQLYYKYATENAELLSKAEHARMLENVNSAAAKLKISPEQYVGGRDNYAALLKSGEIANGPGTVAQLSQFAANSAVVSMKEMLFDRAQKLQYEDMARVVLPFAGAWREILGKYMRQVIVENPASLRRVERTFVGLTKFDPEGDGTGFFERDPQTGNYTFNVPFSDKFSNLTTGLYAPLVAPVRGLSMGLALAPAIGPMASIPTDILLGSGLVPKENEMRQFFLPYGTQGLKGFLPGWFNKGLEVFFANEDAVDSLYSQTYVETVRALYAEGGYNTADPDEREKLFQDAHGKARVLMMMRAVSQLIGPATGTVKFEINTKQGDVYIQSLIKQFQDMQQEDYESAVPKFLDMFGDQALLYVSGKSRSEIGGLQPTEKYDNWAGQNELLFNRYKNAAGFMAPGGDDFSFQVWKKQTERGERQRLSARELLDNAELVVGSAKFRAARVRFGPFPNEVQRAWLREYRAALHRELPGFPEFASFDPGEFDRFVAELEAMVVEPKLENNEAATATRIYLEKRRQAFAAANQAGLVTIRSRAATPLRDYLASVGDALVQKYPDFERVYEQKLQAELMQYEES